MNQVFLLSLTLSLGSHAFHEREQATAALRLLQPEAYLLWASRHHDAEIAARGRFLLHEYYWKVSGELKPTKWVAVPWIDSLPYEYPERQNAINNYLWLAGCCPGTQGIPSGAPIWAKYRKATQLFLYAQLKAGKSPAELVKLLDRMVDYEKGWITKNKHSYTFSPEILEAAAK